jgi:hypothetical protein
VLVELQVLVEDGRVELHLAVELVAYLFPIRGWLRHGYRDIMARCCKGEDAVLAAHSWPAPRLVRLRSSQGLCDHHHLHLSWGYYVIILYTTPFVAQAIQALQTLVSSKNAAAHAFINQSPALTKSPPSRIITHQLCRGFL